MKKIDLSLYFVTENLPTLGSHFYNTILAAAKGGISVLQFRNKYLSDSQYLTASKKILQILSPYNIPLIFNDRYHLASSSNAAGVHVGQNDGDIHLIRNVIGPDKILGLSINSPSQIIQANTLPINYIAISPVFHTATKSDASPPLGLNTIKLAAKTSSHPVVAIGGINASNVAKTLQAGASGIAVVSAISQAPCPQSAAKHLRERTQIHELA